jgi:hypothetical protein
MNIAMSSREVKPPPSMSPDDLTDSSAADLDFDCWLNHHLVQLYDPVVREPLPENLLFLLKERFG